MSRSSVLAPCRREHAFETAVDLAMLASARLLPVAASLVLLGAVQVAAASCTPEPAPYAARANVQR